MLAVTVQQPWAWAILHGGKDVENRTDLSRWRRLEGQRFAVHAGLRWSERGARARVITDAWARQFPFAKPFVRSDAIWMGAVIGTVRCTEVHEADDGCCDSIWAERQYEEPGGRIRRMLVHLMLEDPVPLPIPYQARGMLGIWRLDLPELDRL